MSLLLQITVQSRRSENAEHDLVSSAQRGERRAFDALIQTHQQLLRGFLLRRVDAEIVEDILQETWMAAWTALPKFARQSRFKAWVFSIAMHKVKDHYRRHGRLPVVPLTDEIEGGLAAPDAYAAMDLKCAVRDALSRLPDAQREVLEMYYYAELTLPEIAHALNRNQSTVKYQFYRAHAVVADALGPL